jgi:tRNA(adenine34) deaminase
VQIVDTDEAFMREALRVGTEKGTDPALSPIGCVIVIDGKVVAAERNRVAEDCDATAHAEVIAIRVAGKNMSSSELRGAVLYTTLQPCGMCTMASIWSKVGRIVYGAGREDVHQMYFEARHVDTISFITDAYRDDISIEGGLLRGDCAALYYGPNDHPPADEQGNL